MVHPDFAQQQVPRPDEWETPDLSSLDSLYEPLTALVNSLPDWFLATRQRIRDYEARNGNVFRNGEDPQDERHPVREIERFLRTDMDPDGSGEWEPRRMMGQGGFGSVGLWVRRDEAGRVMDEVVIKEVPRPPGDTLYCYRNPLDRIPISALLNEAVVHRSMNRSRNENIVHLRGYVFASNNQPDEERFRRQDGLLAGADTPIFGNHRLFMEYAPYGNLFTLMTRYRAWSQYLPEAFLWHVFDCLSSAILQMKDGPGRTPVWIADTRRRWDHETEVVHLDIKPQNILIGYERLKDPAIWAATRGTRELPFPTVKLSDFGLAAFTDGDDETNPRDMWYRGTKWYKPPEQQHYGIQWNVPPNGKYREVINYKGNPQNIVLQEERDPDPGFEFLAPTNIWAVGKVMYDLATLSHPHTFQRNWDRTERGFANNGHRLIRDYHQLPFRMAAQSRQASCPYSEDLMELIEQCLSPRIDDRISPRELATQTGRKVDAYDAKFITNQPDDEDEDAGSVKRRKLYYRENEINDMPLGDALFPESPREYDLVMDDRWEDPDWPPLDLPAEKWGRSVPRNNTNLIPRKWRLHNGRIIFPSSPNIINLSSLSGISQQSQADQQNLHHQSQGSLQGTAHDQNRARPNTSQAQASRNQPGDDEGASRRSRGGSARSLQNNDSDVDSDGQDSSSDDNNHGPDGGAAFADQKSLLQNQLQSDLTAYAQAALDQRSGLSQRQTLQQQQQQQQHGIQLPPLHRLPVSDSQSPPQSTTSRISPRSPVASPQGQSLDSQQGTQQSSQTQGTVQQAQPALQLQTGFQTQQARVQQAQTQQAQATQQAPSPPPTQPPQPIRRSARIQAQQQAATPTTTTTATGTTAQPATRGTGTGTTRASRGRARSRARARGRGATTTARGAATAATGTGRGRGTTTRGRARGRATARARARARASARARGIGRGGT